VVGLCFLNFLEVLLGIRFGSNSSLVETVEIMEAVLHQKHCQYSLKSYEGELGASGSCL
jgi:hypothetical protein